MHAQNQQTQNGGCRVTYSSNRESARFSLKKKQEMSIIFLSSLIIYLISYNAVVESKTVKGVLSSRQARLQSGQYITKFCFDGRSTHRYFVKLYYHNIYLSFIIRL